MNNLCNTIKDVFEIFPKLSGLTNLRVIDLQKKIDNVFTKLKMNCKIKEQIQPKDIIYFDLSFSDVWVEIAMTITDDILIKKINFELKFDKSKLKKDFENYLIYLGISFWDKMKDEHDYYLFSQIDVNFLNAPKDESSKSLLNLSKSTSKKTVKRNSVILINNNFKNDATSEKNNSNYFSICDINTNILNAINNISNNSQNKNNNSVDENISFGLEDKVYCCVKFINFTNLICDKVINELAEEEKYSENTHKKWSLNSSFKKSITNSIYRKIPTNIFENFNNSNKNFEKDIIEMEYLPTPINKKEQLKKYFNEHFKYIYLDKTKDIEDNHNILWKKSTEEQTIEYEGFGRYSTTFNVVPPPPPPPFYRNPEIDGSKKFIGPYVSMRKSFTKKKYDMQNFDLNKDQNYEIGFNNSVNNDIEENIPEEIIDEIEYLKKNIDFDKMLENMGTFISMNYFENIPTIARNLKDDDDDNQNINSNVKKNIKNEGVNVNGACNSVNDEDEDIYNYISILKKIAMIFIVIFLIILFIKKIF